MDKYQKLEKDGANSGEGTYGVVYKARNKTTGRLVALKKMKHSISEEGISSTSLREIAVLKHLQHPNIVSLIEYILNEGKLYLVFEHVDKDLKKYMVAVNGHLSPDLVLSYAHQLIQGIDYCHLNGVLHRDLKPQNILVTRDGKLKIADFGLARSFIPPIRPYTHEVITLWYRPPEILLGQKAYSLPADMWSVGAIIAEMSNKRPLFPGDSEIDELFKIFRMFGTPTEKTWPGVTNLPDWNTKFPTWPLLDLSLFLPRLSPEGVDLVQRLLSMDPKHRLSAREALQHPYFEGMGEDL